MLELLTKEITELLYLFQYRQSLGEEESNEAIVHREKTMCCWVFEVSLPLVVDILVT